MAIVHAPDPEIARDKAGRAMHRRADRICVRAATRADQALWAVLLEQQAAGVEGARQSAPEGVQLSLV